MQQNQQALFQRKSSQLEETLQNFIKTAESSFEHKNHEILNRSHDALIKILETLIGQLSSQITLLPSSTRGFTSNTVDKLKNETCKVVKIDFGVVTIKEEREEIDKEINSWLVQQKVLFKARQKMVGYIVYYNEIFNFEFNYIISFNLYLVSYFLQEIMT